MEINSEVAQQVLDELFPVFEALEAQSAAILRFMKEKGIATDKELAPYLEQAGDASNVKWRAARLRISRVLALASGTAEQESAAQNPEKKQRVKNRRRRPLRDASTAKTGAKNSRNLSTASPTLPPRTSLPRVRSKPHKLSAQIRPKALTWSKRNPVGRRKQRGVLLKKQVRPHAK